MACISIRDVSPARSHVSEGPPLLDEGIHVTDLNVRAYASFDLVVPLSVRIVTFLQSSMALITFSRTVGRASFALRSMSMSHPYPMIRHVIAFDHDYEGAFTVLARMFEKLSHHRLRNICRFAVFVFTRRVVIVHPTANILQFVHVHVHFISVLNGSCQFVSTVGVESALFSYRLISKMLVADLMSFPVFPGKEGEHRCSIRELFFDLCVLFRFRHPIVFIS